MFIYLKKLWRKKIKDHVTTMNCGIIIFLFEEKNSLTSVKRGSTLDFVTLSLEKKKLKLNP